jgi:hypothetical protein
VAHACNPSYSGGRAQEDHSSKPAWANSSLRHYLEKNPSQERALSSSPSTIKKKKKIKLH